MGQPDAVFVEDTAVVVDEVAVLTSMGAASRRGELAGIAPFLAEYRELIPIGLPATIDGGDVLRVGRRIFVGRTERTNEQGIQALAKALAPHGYEIVPVPVHGCLHLKSACTALDPETLLVDRALLDERALAGMRLINVVEPCSANARPIGGSVILSAAHPRTAQVVAAQGYDVVTLDVSELEKAEAALTCMSILLEDTRPGR
jgi:dimethylargininase